MKTQKTIYQTIRQWDIRDIFGLVDFIKNNWVYAEVGYYKEYWGKSDTIKQDVLNVELHTGGYSKNEDIIRSLLSNKVFVSMCYKKWERGGHYYFEINPRGFLYKKVAEFAKEKGCSRQYLHHRKHNYDWITAGKRNRFIREKYH